jgi:hypothetical protein
LGSLCFRLFGHYAQRNHPFIKSKELSKSSFLNSPII